MEILIAYYYGCLSHWAGHSDRRCSCRIEFWPEDREGEPGKDHIVIVRGKRLSEQRIEEALAKYRAYR